MEFVYATGGREKYFKALRVNDCVTRAIANATGMDYKVIYDRLAHLSNSSPRNGVPRKVIKKFLEKELGWRWVACMGIGTGCQTHLVANELPKGDLIVNLSKHLTCVKNGVLYDTYDCTRDGLRCVYGYWIKEE